MSSGESNGPRPRAMPRLGARVLVVYLAVRIPGIVSVVDPDLRGLEVDLADGERLRFTLSRATGTFLAADRSGARLLFE